MARPRAGLVALLCTLALSTVALDAVGAAPTGGVPLSLVRDVPLPGKPTRFDYASVDTTGRKLYLAHLGDSTLDVVDLDTLRVKAIVPGVADVHGVTVLRIGPACTQPRPETTSSSPWTRLGTAS